MSQDYKTCQLITENDNLSRPIRTGHNQHTHTGNTRQPELNSRVPRFHSPYRAHLEGYVPSHNSKNTSKLTFEASLKPCRSRTQRQQPNIVATRIAWRRSRGDKSFQFQTA